MMHNPAVPKDDQAPDGDASSRPRVRRSRLATRAAGDGEGEARPGKSSVKELVYRLEEQVKSQTNELARAQEARGALKDEITFMIREMRRNFDDELTTCQQQMKTEVQAARDEIQTLQAQLRVQKGHILALQQQCKGMHQNVKDMNHDVQDLMAEVLGE